MKCMIAAIAVLMTVPSSLKAEKLRIAYSDWPGWVAWEIGKTKGWFEEEAAEVDFVWLDYVASMEAFAQDKVDAVCMTNGDALVTGAGALNPDLPAKPSTCILINDFSFGNDMVVGGPGIKELKDLDGKNIGLEEGFVPHFLFLTGLEEAGIDPKSVTIVNTPTDKTAEALKSGLVSAIAAWQPNSGAALEAVPGASEIFSSADVPGIIFDGLYVDRGHLRDNRREWAKVVKVWYRIVAYMKDEANTEDVLNILAKRGGVSSSKYAEFLEGTYILSAEEAARCWDKRSSISSIYGSSSLVDQFNRKYGVYTQPENIDSYYDSSFIEPFRPVKKKRLR